MFTYGFYNSKEGDRKYDTEQISHIFDGIIEDGVYSNVGEALMVVPGTGMQVIVKTGRAWFKHTWSLNDAYLPLSIEASDTYRNRIDAVVLEVNKNLDVRANSIKVVQGTPATTAQKPTMKHEEGIDQYALAYVTVEPGTDAIVESKIEIAVGKNETPFVQCPLKTVSIEDLFNQWQGEFDEWFDNVQSQLEGDIATNLQNQIDQRVKISDKATPSDITNGTPDKWVDAEMFLEKGVSKVGDIVWSLEQLNSDEFVKCDAREVPYDSKTYTRLLNDRLPLIKREINPPDATFVASNITPYLSDNLATERYMLVNWNKKIWRYDKITKEMKMADKLKNPEVCSCLYKLPDRDSFLYWSIERTCWLFSYDLTQSAEFSNFFPGATYGAKALKSFIKDQNIIFAQLGTNYLYITKFDMTSNLYNTAEISFSSKYKELGFTNSRVYSFEATYRSTMFKSAIENCSDQLYSQLMYNGEPLYVLYNSGSTSAVSFNLEDGISVAKLNETFDDLVLLKHFSKSELTSGTSINSSVFGASNTLRTVFVDGDFLYVFFGYAAHQSTTNYGGVMDIVFAVKINLVNFEIKSRYYAMDVDTYNDATLDYLYFKESVFYVGDAKIFCTAIHRYLNAGYPVNAILDVDAFIENKEEWIKEYTGPLFIKQNSFTNLVRYDDFLFLLTDGNSVADETQTYIEEGSKKMLKNSVDYFLLVWSYSKSEFVLLTSPTVVDLSDYTDEEVDAKNNSFFIDKYQKKLYYTNASLLELDLTKRLTPYLPYGYIKKS